LVRSGEAVGGVLDEQAYAVGDRVRELGEWPCRDDRTGFDLEPSGSEPVVEEVFGEQRDTAGALMDERHHGGVGFAAGPGCDQFAHLVDPERVEGDQRGPLAEAQADGESVDGLAGSGPVAGPVGGDDEQWGPPPVSGQGVEEVEGRSVTPVQVLECEHERRRRWFGTDRVEQLPEHAIARGTDRLGPELVGGIG
jgi:hypothetical protein